MKRIKPHEKLSFVLLIIVFNHTLISCTAEDDGSTQKDFNSANIIIEYSQIDYEIVELINAYRISIDLAPLNVLNEASKEANTHTQYMIDQGTPSHDYFYVRSQNLMNAVDAISVSENVGYGFSSAQSIVSAWLNSEGHKENIENPNVTDFGISTQQDIEGKTILQTYL